MKVAFCTPGENNRDGIFDCVQSYLPQLRREVEIEIVPLLRGVPSPQVYRRMIMSSNRCDLCHLQHNYIYFNGIFPWRERFTYFLKRIQAPLLITFHEYRFTYPVSPPPPLNRLADIIPRTRRILLNQAGRLGMRAWMKHYHRAAFRKAALIHVHTSRHRRLLEEIGAASSSLRVLPLPVLPFPGHNLTISRMELKKKLGWMDKFVMVTPGFLSRRKGYEQVLRIMDQLPSRVRYIIAGGAMNKVGEKYLRELEEEIHRRRLFGKVTISGYLSAPRLGEIIKGADLILAPYSGDMQGSASLSRALGEGGAVLASDVAVHREVAEREACLELFPADSVSGMKEKIICLLNQPVRLEELRRRARSYTSRYGPDAYARSLLNYYREIGAG